LDGNDANAEWGWIAATPASSGSEALRH
jgi:hypothetical protein